MSVLKELFNGSICPVESCVPETEEYKIALKTVIGYADVLAAELACEQKELLDRYLDAHAKTEKLVQEEVFRQGFLLGVHLQKESRLQEDTPQEDDEQQKED